MGFVFGNFCPGATGGTGGSGTFSPATAYNWTAPQNAQLVDTTNNIWQTVTPEVADTYSKTFNFSGDSFPNSDATNNFVVRLGHNIDNGGGPVDVTRSTLQDEWEQHYVNSGVEVVERHLAFTPVGLAVQRFITFLGRSDGVAPASPDQNSLGLIADQVYIRSRANVVEYLRVDATAGFNVQNLAVGVKVDMTSAGNGVSMYAPASNTGKYISFVYNSGEFAQMNKFGELYLAGSGLAGAGTRSALLTVVGRASTTHTLQIESSGTVPIIQVASDASYIISKAATFYFRGGDFTFQNSSNVSQFLILTDGKIRTNQTAAATVAVGTLAGKMPIYNIAGTLIGYVPLYDAIT